MLVLEGHKQAVRCLAWAPNGTALVSGGDDRIVRLWRLAAPTKPSVVLKTADTVEAVAFAPDGHTVAVGLANGDVLLRDVGRSRALEGHSQGVRALAFAPSGQALTSAGWDATVKVQELGRGGKVMALGDNGGVRLALAYSPDGALLACGRLDGSVVVFKKSSESTILARHKGGIYAVAFAPDGKRLASGGADSKIVLWDVPAGKQRGTLEGHTWTVYSLSFAPDGGTLLSGGADGSVRLWDVASCREQAAYRWHKSWVTAVAFAPDGMRAAAASEDSTIVVWDIDS
jgi:WD40 repeat protein